jgi:hypothetical protein
MEGPALSGPERTTRRSSLHRDGICASRYLNRTKNHTASSAMPVCGSQAATTGST